MSPSFRGNLPGKATLQRRDAIDLAPDPGDAEKVDGVMNRLPESGPVRADGEFSAWGASSLDSFALPEVGARSTAWVAVDSGEVDPAAVATRDLLDEVISHIHRAGLLINSCNEVVRPALVEQLVDVTRELDAVIYQLQAAGPEGHDAVRLTDFPSPHMHWAWSEGGRRWINMTFNENQAWLARPDLDPVAFASHEVMS